MSFARRCLTLSGLIWLAGAVSCSSSTSPPAATIKVAINAPSGVTVTATLKGPQGFTRTLTQTLAYTQLVPGTYTVTAVVSPPAQSSPIVDTVFVSSVSGSPAQIVAGGQATVTVNVSLRPGSGALWVVGASNGG